MDYEKFKDRLGSWGPRLKPFIESEACNGIYAELKALSTRGKKLAPLSINTFRAFEVTPISELQVVFLLQDPYPWEKNGVLVADGVALSSFTTGLIQPSLEEFYGGIEDDLYKGLNLLGKKDPDLAYLCRQGVMMLNSSLTVELNKPSSHFDLWKPFTTYLFEEIFELFERDLIFVLCGEKSMYYEKFINPLRHRIFKLEHPANAARKMRKWNHDRIFSKINVLLQENNHTFVEWMKGNVI